MDMKKMFAVSTVALCATVGFGEIASANIVGYSSKADDGKAYQTMGSMFVTVGGEGTWKLGDMKMVVNGNDGGAYGYSFIQFLDPATSKIDRDNVYTYFGTVDGATEGSDDGWYSYPDDNASNDVEFPAGTAFLCNFDTTYSSSITFSGQVLTSDVTIDCAIEGAQVAYMYMVNPFAAAISLGDVKMLVNNNDGGAYGYSFIQFLDPATSKIDRDKVYTYFGTADGATADSDDGWYTYPNDEYSNDVSLGIGEGFLCNFDTTYSNKIKFVSPIKQ